MSPSFDEVDSMEAQEEYLPMHHMVPPADQQHSRLSVHTQPHGFQPSSQAHGGPIQQQVGQGGGAQKHQEASGGGGGGEVLPPVAEGNNNSSSVEEEERSAAGMYLYLFANAPSA